MAATSASINVEDERTLQCFCYCAHGDRRGQYFCLPVVLGCLADGLPNSPIADKSGIEEGTAKVHVHRILHKLGVKSRAEAIATALKKAILQLPEPGSS